MSGGGDTPGPQTPFLWKMNLPGTSVSVFGKVENNILTCYAQTLERALVADENGLITSGNNVDEYFFTSLVKPKLDALGISYTSIAYDTSTYSVNDNVENWNEYTLLS